MGQQRFATRTTGYIDSTSLAQPRVAAHQEYKSQSKPEFKFSRARFLQLRKTCRSFLAVFAGYADVLAVISTASSDESLMYCGFGWKAKDLSSTLPLFSHRHQIPCPLLHSLCTMNRL
jgi:hypothetical protein